MNYIFTNYFNKTRFDKKRRILFSKLKNNNNLFRWTLRNSLYHEDFVFNDKLRFYIMKKKTYLNRRNESVSRIVNRCIFTDNPHSVNKQFRVSRMTFKELTSERLLTGVTQLPVKK